MRGELGINNSVNELMRLKPDDVHEDTWRGTIQNGTVQQSVRTMILYFLADCDPDRLEDLIRNARGGKDHDENGSHQQQTAPGAGIQHNHSQDTGDTLTTPAHLTFREAQQQPAGTTLHGSDRFWDRFLRCLFPWT